MNNLPKTDKPETRTIAAGQAGFALLCAKPL